METLNDDHIRYIQQDLSYRGIVADGIQDELLDHICSHVETEMANGHRFIEAYQIVISKFGHDAGLQETQKHVIQSDNLSPKSMLRNNIIIAFRNIRKHRFYSAINVLGLSTGIAACLIIVLYIIDELQYDRHNSYADRIYRVEADINFGGNQFQMAYRSAPEAHTLVEDYPEVESAVRFRASGTYLVRPADAKENLKARHVIWTDSTFFDIFSVDVIEGNAKKALTEPASFAISKSLAEKYFPGESALGKSLILDNVYTGRVTAVYNDFPSTSHFHFDILVGMVGSWPICKEAASTSFLGENFLTYLLLKPGADPKALEKKLPGFLEQHVGPEIATAFGEKDFSIEKFEASGNKYQLSLRPLTDIHLHSDIRGELEPNSNIVYIYLFSTIAVFILGIACINFMNLSTARSSNRAREVGIRKVMGSLRYQLIRQFMTESTIITLMSIIAAVGFAYVLLPLFNDLSLKELQIPFDQAWFYLTLGGAAFVIAIFSGLYPSFFLSAFKPVNVLKGQLASGMKGSYVRSSLVVFQFVITIFLIISAITVNQQLNFIQNKNLGFEKDQVIVIHDAYGLRPNNVEAFKKEVLQSNLIESGSISGHLPVENEDSYRSHGAVWKEGTTATTENMISFHQWGVDYDYIKTFGMKMKHGRAFSEEFPSDRSGVILNETAARILELGENPIGQRIQTFEDNGRLDPSTTVTWTVVGITEDFHFSSMKNSIEPLGMFLYMSDGNVSFRFKAENTEEVINTIERSWKKLAVGQPFLYSFLDEDFERMYASEQRLGKIFLVFATLAILIACIGLFALTAFAAEQRTKEIGIRKVLGASVSSIVFLLSKEFGRLIIIAFALAVPIAWFAITWWLESYSYKVEIGIFIYAIAGVIALLIAWLTMSYQSFKAASSDPVKSLKND